MNPVRTFFICPRCFRVCETDEHCHGHRMVLCDAGEAGDRRRMPEMNGSGRFHSRAPHWFLEAVGWISERPPPGADRR